MGREDYQEPLDKFNHFKLDENIGTDRHISPAFVAYTSEEAFHQPI